jgi:preprotein translocase subunit SecE
MNNILVFFRESWAELKQVAWLTVPQMIASTWMVIILVVIMAIFVGGVDYLLSRIFGFIR